MVSDLPVYVEMPHPLGFEFKKRANLCSVSLEPRRNRLMVSNIPFGSYQPEWTTSKRTPQFSVGISEKWPCHLPCIWIFFSFRFFCFFGLRGEKKIDYRDIGREHDHRLAKRKKKCF